ncbi:Ribosomal protein L19 [Candidatus Magnetobacterium bavaricum]|uniref:Large ribosomal subunit protein bL19 n=1 Tax=Candidatus Magnetobacterium bavaricum TaxID=29290 RepID=A0A0F3GNX7_9BACT|nr:Ribosomal protein L19 [Candidatus Magnetobacterium bavaricum]KJU83592.1 Ribosomal protein L19 [Candidatus Magnetobacterium bavaricum]
MNLIKAYEERFKKTIPEFHIGDTLRISVRVVEGDKERIQPYEGYVIARKSGGIRETVTVRKISFGVGVERIFPLHSPIIKEIQLIKRGDVRRAKLYYLRHKKGKDAKIKEKARDIRRPVAAKLAS